MNDLCVFKHLFSGFISYERKYIVVNIGCTMNDSSTKNLNGVFNLNKVPNVNEMKCHLMLLRKSSHSVEWATLKAVAKQHNEKLNVFCIHKQLEICEISTRIFQTEFQSKLDR